jgi:hypothetical protein
MIRASSDFAWYLTGRNWPFGLLLAWGVVWIAYFGFDPNAGQPPFQYSSRVITGNGYSDTLTHVQALPDVPALRGPFNQHLDLAYHWKSDGTGEWAGFGRTGSRSYVTVGGWEFAAMLTAAGVHDLPSVPERPVDRSLWWNVLLVAMPFFACLGLRRNP